MNSDQSPSSGVICITTVRRNVQQDTEHDTSRDARRTSLERAHLVDDRNDTDHFFENLADDHETDLLEEQQADDLDFSRG